MITRQDLYAAAALIADHTLFSVDRDYVRTDVERFRLPAETQMYNEHRAIWAWDMAEAMEIERVRRLRAKQQDKRKE